MAGFDGFPLSANTNAFAWYTVHDAHEPLLQLWNAINERCYAAGVEPLAIVETNVLDDVWMSTNMWVGGYWYWSWDGPDTNGQWEIGFEGDYPDELVWVTPQAVDGDDVFYGATWVSNRWQTSVEVITTNHFGAIDGGSVTGFPFVSRQLLSVMESKLEVLGPYYKYPGTNATWSEYWETSDSYQEVAGSPSTLHRRSPRLPACYVDKYWVDLDLGYYTNVVTNAWGEVTDAQWFWDSGTTSTNTNAVAGWDTNRAPYRLYAYELDRIYHAVTNLRFTARASHYSGSSSGIFSGGTSTYTYASAAVDRTNTWSIADNAAVSNFTANIDTDIGFDAYPEKYSIRRVARHHPYSANNPAADTYDHILSAGRIETATLDDIPTNTACDISIWAGDYSTIYTNDTIWSGYSATATNGSGDWNIRLSGFYPFWTEPHPSSAPWSGNGVLTNIATMGLAYQVLGNTNATTVMSEFGSMALPDYAELPVLPVYVQGMNYQRRGYQITDWIAIFDWDFEYK